MRHLFSPFILLSLLRFFSFAVSLFSRSLSLSRSLVHPSIFQTVHSPIHIYQSQYPIPSTAPFSEHPNIHPSIRLFVHFSSQPILVLYKGKRKIHPEAYCRKHTGAARQPIDQRLLCRIRYLYVNECKSLLVGLDQILEKKVGCQNFSPA